MDEKRFTELYNRACEKHYTVYSDFLNLDEQSRLLSLKIPFNKFGGYSNAERVIAAFGEDTQDCRFPLALIEIAPINKKFADALTHRDFLGAVMNLGIKRELLGDIIISNNTGYLFCLTKIKDYILENIKRVKHTTVCANEVTALPQDILNNGKQLELIVSSVRADAVISSCLKISRSESLQLFKNEKVFINNRKMLNSSYKLEENDIVSVRGCGRIIFQRVLKFTKKERLVISVEIFK